jgi:hypothetical protein
MTSLNYLSIDVGRRNLGFSILNKDNFNFKFGIYDLSERIFLTNELMKRKQKPNKKTLSFIIKSLNEFLDIIVKKYNINVLIIEKQVRRNTMALNIMWVIIEYGLLKNWRVIIFNARDKFKYEVINYDSKHKEHKKICVRYAKNILKFNCIDPKVIDDYRKKDDISDAICMLFIVVYSDKSGRENGERRKRREGSVENFKIRNESVELIKKMMCENR